MYIEFTNIFKILLALVLSSLIGYEREASNKSAGLRTCMLVTLSSTMVMIFSELMLSRGLTMDAVRAPSYILTGIGFIGGGVIMSKGGKVEGITTAALMLILVPLGLLIGMGEYSLATICTIIIYFVLKLKHIERRAKSKKKIKKQRIKK